MRMKKPTPNAQFAQEQFVAYQQKLNEHRFYSQADKQLLQDEADYWRKQFEDAEDATVIESLGLTTVKKP